MASVLQVSPPKFFMHFSYSSYLPQASAILLSLIRSVKSYLWAVGITKLLNRRFCFQSPVTWCPLGRNVFLNSLISNTHGLCSSLNVRDKVLAHPPLPIYILYIKFETKPSKLNLCPCATFMDKDYTSPLCWVDYVLVINTCSSIDT